MKLLAREFELIERVFARASKRHDVTISIGDDAAITRVPAGYELVTTTDSLVAGTHFEHGADPVSVGHRSLAVNLSDLAAMGAEPCWVSIALHIPALDEAWVEGFAAGFFALAERHNIDLIGGDTVRGWLAVTITAQGIVPEDAAVLRSGAHAGDALYVTGFPGTAALWFVELIDVLPTLMNCWTIRPRSGPAPADKPQSRSRRSTPSTAGTRSGSRGSRTSS